MSDHWRSGTPTAWYFWLTESWSVNRSMNWKRLERHGESIRPDRTCRTQSARSGLAKFADDPGHWRGRGVTGGHVVFGDWTAKAGNAAAGTLRIILHRSGHGAPGFTRAALCAGCACHGTGQTFGR